MQETELEARGFSSSTFSKAKPVSFLECTENKTEGAYKTFSCCLTLSTWPLDIVVVDNVVVLSLLTNDGERLRADIPEQR